MTEEVHLPISHIIFVYIQYNTIHASICLHLQLTLQGLGGKMNPLKDFLSSFRIQTLFNQVGLAEIKKQFRFSHLVKKAALKDPTSRSHKVKNNAK